MKKIKVKAPATIANLVCGFDVLGMAVCEPYDEMELIACQEPGIRIIHTDAFGLPEDPEKNIAGVALRAMMDDLKLSHGFEVIITKKIKPGSGIGSSAASAAGVVAAADFLLETRLPLHTLLTYAMEGEAMASGSRHADNLAPCLSGGITLIRDTPSLDIIQLDKPDLFIALVHPQIEVKTSFARSILPTQVPLGDAVKQWANVGGLVSGFFKKDYDLISRSLTDHIIEPIRSKLIPGYQEVMHQCRQRGILGGGISGSGPSLFMLGRDWGSAEQAAEIMAGIYTRLEIPFNTYVTKINDKGVELMNS